MIKCLIIFLLFLIPISIFSQLHPSVAFQISSTTQGFLLPQMIRAQIEQINNPADGLMLICTDCQNESGIHIFNVKKSSWMRTATVSESSLTNTDTQTFSLSTAATTTQTTMNLEKGGEITLLASGKIDQGLITRVKVLKVEKIIAIKYIN